MGCKAIFTLLRDEPPFVRLVFFYIRELVNCRATTWNGIRIEKGELITSWAHFADLTGLTVKLIRTALARLSALDAIRTSSAERKFTRIKLLALGSDLGSVSGSDLGSTNEPKKQSVSKNVGSDLGSVSGSDLGDSLNKDNLAVGRSPGVDVGSSGSNELKSKAESSERSAPSPGDLKKRETETAWVRDILFAGCPLYQADKKLLTINDKGSPAILTLWRAWKATYSNVDLFLEVKKAHAWEVANPARQKKNRLKFLNSWVNRDHEEGGVFKRGPVTHEKNERRAPPGHDLAPREVVRQKAPEPVVDEIETPDQAADRHRAAVAALGQRYCKDAECAACGKRRAPPGITLDIEAELEELPV